MRCHVRSGGRQLEGCCLGSHDCLAVHLFCAHMPHTCEHAPCMYLLGACFDAVTLALAGRALLPGLLATQNAARHAACPMPAVQV